MSDQAKVWEIHHSWLQSLYKEKYTWFAIQTSLHNIKKLEPLCSIEVMSVVFWRVI
jgi:hypothetical protein